MVCRRGEFSEKSGAKATVFFPKEVDTPSREPPRAAHSHLREKKTNLGEKSQGAVDRRETSHAFWAKIQ